MEQPRRFRGSGSAAIAAASVLPTAQNDDVLVDVLVASVSATIAFSPAMSRDGCCITPPLVDGCGRAIDGAPTSDRRDVFTEKGKATEWSRSDSSPMLLLPLFLLLQSCKCFFASADRTTVADKEAHARHATRLVAHTHTHTPIGLRTIIYAHTHEHAQNHKPKYTK